MTGFEFKSGRILPSGGSLQMGELPFADALRATQDRLFVLTMVKYDSSSIDSSILAAFDHNLLLVCHANCNQ